ncbi:GNAT family N-acetyltransferase [Alkalicoccobacillus murimartini]|nr:GNAT family N-acetyltransferase [Alkalicoccobacillus murimartini]
MILQDTVNAGASIGFLSPMQLEEAEQYWKQLQIDEHKILLLAFIDHELAGTVHLDLVNKPNGWHRAEICKLIVNPKLRRAGVGRALMKEIEKTAIKKNRSLLVLDTREGDPSNRLYRSIGYIQAGAIPNFASNSDGALETTNLYYKIIG